MTTSSSLPKHFYIKTFGCQMNEADTERMTVLLREQGMEPTEEPDKAQLILINGCTVREKAVHKALSLLGTFQPSKSNQGQPRNAPKPLIGIGGCVGQLDRERLFQQAPYLDFVFGTDTLDQLPEMVYRAQQGERHFVVADFDPSLQYSTVTKVDGQKTHAFVNIMKGCDKYCSYCIVPYTRGREKSRLIDEVVDDVARLVASGVKEVTLLGQNVNSFGKGNPNLAKREPFELHNPIGKVGPHAGEENFPQLLRAIDQDARCQALKRIRFTSSHPLDFSDELIACYAPASQGGVQRLARHLHLPVQSGSNTVLQKMGRHHRIEHYIDQMERLKTLCPEIGLSSDFIVGFPTETQADFEQTLALLDRLRYDALFAFAYSPRPGTRAAQWPDNVTAEEKKRRLNLLLQHQRVISEKRYRECVGQTFEILVEGLSKNQNWVDAPTAAPPISASSNSPPRFSRLWMGRTSCHRVVHFLSESPRSLIGQCVPVQITRATAVSLEGVLHLSDSEGQSLLA